MKRSFSAALLGLAASASAAGVTPQSGGGPRVTAKPTAAFAACFTAAEDRAAQPWSFVPKENGGGTFSNVGARGVANPYFMKVADLGSRREIRLEAPADAAVLRAVDRCV